MDANRWRNGCKAVLVVLAGLVTWSSATAQNVQDEAGSRWWLGAGMGGAAVNSLAPAPSAGRGAFAASMDFGYRLTPRWGVGLEFGGVIPLGGCADWDCAGHAERFAPTFTHLSAFGEYRPAQSGWRIRAGAGVSRFCYRRHWSDAAWGWGDTLDVVLAAITETDLDSDREGGAGGYRCDARMNALGGAVSVGHDWPVKAGTPVSVGVRLTAEAASFGATPAIGLPGFRHRAVMLTVHLNIN